MALLLHRLYIEPKVLVVNGFENYHYDYHHAFITASVFILHHAYMNYKHDDIYNIYVMALNI